MNGFKSVMMINEVPNDIQEFILYFLKSKSKETNKLEYKYLIDMIDEEEETPKKKSTSHKKPLDDVHSPYQNIPSEKLKLNNPSSEEDQVKNEEEPLIKEEVSPP